MNSQHPHHEFDYSYITCMSVGVMRLYRWWDGQQRLCETVESMLTIKGPQGRINRAVWGPLNKTIVSAGEDAVIHMWNSETGKLPKESDKETGHKKTITSLTKSADSSHLLTALGHQIGDTYQDLCGQDASAVTTTDHCAGKFEARFFGKVLQEEIGGVKRHFGPINALAFNPDAAASYFFLLNLFDS
ncbi:hypothetical protein CsSME_00048406 [Camellia sinensis var. sinensis]